MSTTDACILCTINEKELRTGKYWIKIDVVQKKKADDKLKLRNKEGFTATAAGFLGGGKSQPIRVGDDDAITFEIEEALRPMTKFKEGQDRLKCKNIKKDIISRQIHLVPNEDSSENHAAITFYHKGEFQHQITISDISKGDRDMEQASIRSNRLSDSGAAKSLGLEAVPISPRTLDHGSVDSDRSDSDADDGTTATPSIRRTLTTRSTDSQSTRHTQRSRSTDLSRGTRPTDSGSSRFSQSTRSADFPGSSCMDEIKLPRVFSNKSLHSLSDALGPSCAKRLLVFLNMGEAHIDTELHNHPRDCGRAYANLFIKWQEKEFHRGEAFMRQEMNKGLQSIGRNDIRMKFMKFASEDTELTPDDLK